MNKEQSIEIPANLFSQAIINLPTETIQAMSAVSNAITSVGKHIAYQQHVLQWSPDIAQHSVKSQGVFLGYDFHLTPTGPKLIEVNTNAGGGLLNATLRQQHQLTHPDHEELKKTFLNMFIHEWELQNPGNPLRCIAIVDHEPTTQFLYSEFLLFQKLFIEHSIETVIVDPRELTIKSNGLYYHEIKIDLVYNRLTDFFFTSEHNKTLKTAYLNNLAVITPHPRAYALYANKYNLTVLSDAVLLNSWEIPKETIGTLVKSVPHTFMVDASHADTLWKKRDKLFFKPATGFGSKGSYRGDKLTTRVFKEILATNHYIAQELTPPGIESLTLDNTEKLFKLDLRCFVYAGETQLITARLYQGQTTNFRTIGGGFGAVIFNT